MRKQFIASLFVGFVVSPAIAQPSDIGPTTPQKIYFLVDASDSMDDASTDSLVPKAHADRILARELSKLVSPSSRPTASITFYRSNAKECDSGIASVRRQLPIPDPLPKSPSSMGATNLGSTFAAALDDAKGDPARIVIISDGGQSDHCGFHICTVAGERLPSLPNVTIDRFWAREDETSAPPFPCIDEAIQARKQASTDPNKKYAEEDNSHTPDKENDSAEGNADWDGANHAERWLWLSAFILGVLSAISFSARWLLKALSFEKRTGDIQERQRAILTGQGDADEHRREILRVSSLENPKHWYLTALLVAGIGLSASSAIVGAILLFAEGEIAGASLYTARQLAWLILSSNFSNAFAILAVTPVLTAGAVYARSLQARQTFALTKNAAAEDEAKRRDDELDTLFDYMDGVRTDILSTVIESPWADLTKRGTPRRGSSKFSDEEHAFIASAKKQLLEIAQGPTPSRIGATKKSLSDQISKLERYAPKRHWWESNWDLPGLIADLDKSQNAEFQKKALDWRQLADAVRKDDGKAIRASLKKLTEKPSNK